MAETLTTRVATRAVPIALLVPLVVSTWALVCACNDEQSNKPAASGKVSVSTHDLSPQELLDIVRLYCQPIHPKDLHDPKAFDVIRRSSPKFKLWRAKRIEHYDKQHEWRAIVDQVRPQLPAFNMRDDTMPASVSYEAVVWPEKTPKPIRGQLERSLVVRLRRL